MIIICIILLLALLLSAAIFILSGLIYVLWPIALIIIFGLTLDILVIRSIIKNN